MAQNLAQKIISEHLVEGEIKAGREVKIQIDQTLTQDATGTLAYLQFEALGVSKVKTELSVSYVDHNLLQTDFRNADDHRYLQSVAAKYGLFFSRPGNGVSHQVHLERFGAPGKTLLGSDSHTPTGGCLGMIAIGAGGLDVALAMSGRPFNMNMPKIVGIELEGSLSRWVSPKDVILYLLGKLKVKGGVGKILEYFGPGVKSLDVPDRAAICNMGTELGATTSIFPSDKNTRTFLESQGREKNWVELRADPDAHYDQVLKIDLGEIEPLIARPSSPDKVVTIKEVQGERVSQVIIGSCASSSLRELLMVARVLENKKIHPDVSLEINPGSKQVLENLAALNGFLSLLKAGARVHQPGCLGCIGMGQAPASNTSSLRTFPRNFPGRSGTKDDKVFLCSPEVALASALSGSISDPRELGDYPDTEFPKELLLDDSLIIHPPKSSYGIRVFRGPNIKPLPAFPALPETLEGEALIKLGDNVSTDDILPAGADILPLRSNIPAISAFVFSRIDPGFASRAKKLRGGFLIGGENYGQGSSREHAALAPRYLEIKGVFAKSFARIHKSNLINFGILPLEFEDPTDLDRVKKGDKIKIINVRSHIEKGRDEIHVEIDGSTKPLKLNATERERRIILAGGMLNYAKELI
jgi:aconitate hydratase